MTTAPIPRPATPDDLPAIRALHEANWRRDYAALVPPAVMEARLQARMDAYWADGLPEGLTVFVVSDGATILGFVAFDPDRDGAVFIENLHVVPAARGQGIGRALIRAVAQTAPTRPIRLEVMDGNTAARATYRAWGGQEGPAFDGSLLDHPQPERAVSWPSGGALIRSLRASAQ